MNYSILLKVDGEMKIEVQMQDNNFDFQQCASDL